ncbi:hypothetical protein [Sunxiuqinia indica]|uniref:hypothetical protein n=1 Tax=Sunxiuqinia indica TaxID=2692584 RepID=UPI0013580BE4|nr:hypothetical protein [Sunxiuqinia indica]
MKLKFKLLFLFFGLLYLSAQADEYTREEHSAYLKSVINSLDITNKFGTITINDFGGDSIIVDALITVENSNEGKAEYLLDQIEIKINRVGSLLKVETEIKDDFKTKRNFSIDYTINIPADRNLTVANKFGDVVINKLNANGKFNISYGNISTGDLLAPENSKINMEIAYGKADIESVNHLQTEIRYSKLFIGQALSMYADSKYSGLNIEEIDALTLESKYDGVSIEEINSLKADSKYTNYDIEKLGKSLVLDTQYGSVQIDKVADTFENIDITNNYGGIEIGLDEAEYYLNASCDYCDVKYPEEKFVGNREKEDHRFSVLGNIGNATKAKVTIKSRYGGIKLEN